MYYKKLVRINNKSSKSSLDFELAMSYFAMSFFELEFGFELAMSNEL